MELSFSEGLPLLWQDLLPGGKQDNRLAFIKVWTVVRLHSGNISGLSESREEFKLIGNVPGLMEPLLLGKHAASQESRIVPIATSGEQSTMAFIIIHGDINHSKGGHSRPASSAG